MVLKRFTPLLVLSVLMLAMTSACGNKTTAVSPDQKITAIAETVRADLTQVSALTPSVTPTLTPTITPTLSSVTPTVMITPAQITTLSTSTSGDNSQYVADVTIPDNALVLPGTKFTKTWSVTNNGITTWTKDYKLIYLDGLQDSNGALAVNLTQNVTPGQTVNVSVDFTAPTSVGTYSSYWKLYTASGYVFGEPLSLLFIVSTDTPTPTTTGGTPGTTASVTPTVTNTP